MTILEKQMVTDQGGPQTRDGVINDQQNVTDARMETYCKENHEKIKYVSSGYNDSLLSNQIID